MQKRSVVLFMLFVFFSGFSAMSLAIDDAKPKASGNVPIVLIHGLGSNPGAWNTALTFFSDKKYEPIYNFDYSTTTGEHVVNNSERLFAWLKEEKLTEGPVIIMGHSLGGIVARKMMVDHPEVDVIKLITLATPNQGADWPSTLCPNFVCGDAIEDLKPETVLNNNPLLEQLNKISWYGYTPETVLTYTMEQDELVPADSSPILGGINLKVSPDAQPYINLTPHHGSTVEKAKVLEDALKFVKTAYKILPAAPQLSDGSCTFNPEEGTVYWADIQGAPAGLEVRVFDVANNQVIPDPKNPEATRVLANAGELKIANGEYSISFFDPAEGISSYGSKIQFYTKTIGTGVPISSCETTITNNRSLISNWDVSKVISYTPPSESSAISAVETARVQR